MAHLKVCSPRPNGDVFREDRPCPSPPSPSLPTSNPDPSAVSPESWARGEDATRDIVSKIQPTLVTHQARKEVIQYVQSLITSNVRCKVFPYGSVPLKSYLPDGDIDLTAFSSANIEESFVTDVHAILKGEENNEAAQYLVKDVHCIDAEVKLVKCIVQNIVVDISFNQLGGLCTLRFLEQVDHYIGKHHLFKRSIILIKAWCYYESRILGAHHGLISTYALETLILYIFHMFHSSLDGPLTVLYRFLDYFSKFDWENYCISLNGPVCKSSLPDIVAEVPENGGDDLLLSEEFIRNCVEMFSVPSKLCETNLRSFPLKHLNIIDPLKENNNLGRSVNRGSFYRICSAFKYGARKLGWILSLPGERIANELNKFFANTLDRHGSNCQTNDKNDALSGGLEALNILLELGGDFDNHCLNLQYGPYFPGSATSPPLLPSPPLSPQPWKENQWGVTSEAVQFHQNINSQTNINGIAWGAHAYHANDSTLSVAAFRGEKKKPRGTGTYIPNASFQSYRPYKDRFLPGRGRKQAPGTCFPLQRHAFSYGFAAAPQESISQREYNRQLSEAEYPVLGRGNSAKSDYHPPHLSIWESFHDVGLSNLPEKPECRSLSPPSWESHIPEVDSQSELFRANEERIEEQSYHLKNDDDFPPLTPQVPLKEGLCVGE
ncbi:PREDICTED: uncharacterized protein LOC103340921 [Prunus mume]|uniref:Uncharacterized protein LOC103340921 n=1 Tax=Prunus mume TaxID=102107 RepID=A0ABM0PPQ1_PRUMU|nr:PREDICTED: uncharacterized protein LOC103340921 [Prunus mume]